MDLAPDGDFFSSNPPVRETLTFGSSQSEASFTVTTVKDNLDEADGSVTATLVARTGYTIDPDRAEGTTIVTDNDLPEVSLSEIDTERDYLTHLPIAAKPKGTLNSRRLMTGLMMMMRP